jgi:hypothetical protein
MEMDLLPESWWYKSSWTALSDDALFYCLREMDVAEVLFLCHKIEDTARTKSTNLEGVFGE